MNQAVEEITDKLIGAIKTDKTYYTPKDLLSSGFPNFIVEHIRLSINNSLTRELKLPATAWVDWNNSLVQEAWVYFRQVVLSNSRVPKNKLYAIVQQVIDDLLSIYLEPGKNLADYLYQNKLELTFEEMIERTGQLSMQKHFGRALPLYMQKRELKTLEKNRCQLLIQKLDANLVASYSSEDWIDALQPIFILCGGKIPSQLLSRFFTDKNLHELAAKIKSADRKYSKDDLLKVLSGADLNVEVKTESLKKDRTKTESVTEDVPKVDAKEQKLMDSFSDSYNSDEYVDDGSINALFRSQNDKSIFNNYGNDSDDIIADEKKKDESGRFHENLTSVLDRAAHSFKGVSAEKEEEKVEEKTKETEKVRAEEKVKTENDKTKTVEAADEGEDVIWQHFLTKEHRDTLLWKPSETEDDDGAILLSEEDIIDEKPPFSDVKLKKDTNKKKEDLKIYLLGQEVYLIEEIFGGSEAKYVKALNEINKFGNWEKASDFIYSKVFSSNKVDMYSEAAVDFIDQLQSYFQEYKN